ncbi:MAG: Pyridoxine/pyridoxamine 5'-phosphate oxidase [Phycisphaerales bacterium]|nr:Pyridoxine/pyridoxamine 5'-phosphate oxidase [Phycisphaerales bacterium]
MLEDIIIKLASAESLPEVLPADPFPLLTAWYDQAKSAKQTPNPDAVALASATADGRPSVRMVLCRRVDPAGSLVFYTNYHSRKGRELEANPRAAMVFHWDYQGRQARTEGFVVKTTESESDEYFAHRALLSRLGAWASRQSTPLASRKDLIAAVASAASRLKISPAALMAGEQAVSVPRPPHWGGFRLWVDRVELWCGGNGRLHDRAEWVRSRADDAPVNIGATPAFNPWRAQRLSP